VSHSPAGDTTSSLPAGSPKQGMRAKVRSWLIGLPDRPGSGKPILMFASLWPFLRGVWTLLIIAGPLVTVVNWIFVTAQEDIPDWHKLLVVHLALANPLQVGMSGGLVLLLTFFSFVSYRIKKAAAEENERRQRAAEEQAKLAREEAEQQQRAAYEQARLVREEAERQVLRLREEAEREHQALRFVLKPVEQLSPDKVPYIHQYVKAAYIFREADEATRQALRASINRVSGTPLGICILGRPMLGKTRLAFEMMRAELANWTFVKWPHNTRPEDFDFAVQKGKKLILWLDDLHEYASQAEALTLLDLPRYFEEVTERLVVVATCRDGNDWKKARETLGRLLARLIIVELSEISDTEANQLAALLKDAGVEAQRDQFDKTPGSLLLGVARMRDERYPKLPEPAKKLLWAMKLLRSAYIYDYYTAPCVRATASDLFHLAESEWQAARDVLCQEGFVRLGKLNESSERVLVPTADVYLDECVSDYPAPGGTLADDWPALEQSLIRRKDAETLVALGNAYSDYPLGNLRTNQQHAEACYRAVLEVNTRQDAPSNWASTQNKLGLVLGEQAWFTEGVTRATLLEQARAAFQAAQEIYTRQSAPADWAMTQNNLGRIFHVQAYLAEGSARVALLEQARAAFQAAQEIYTRQSAPADWAMTQNNLGEVLREQAVITEGTEGATLLEEAAVTLRAALEVFTQKSAPAEWAAAQDHLGHVLINQALRTENVARAKALLRQAVTAFRSALRVRMRQTLPVKWAATQANWGHALVAQALLAQGTARKKVLLRQATAAFRAALEVFTREAAPSEWAQCQYDLGSALYGQALLAEGTARTLREEAVAAYRAALEVHTWEHTHTDRATNQRFLGLMLCELVDITEGEGRAELLEQAATAFRAALGGFTRETTPSEWAATQFNLGNILADQASLAEGAARVALLDQAVGAHRAALEVYTYQTDPTEWAATQSTLVHFYLERATSLEEADKDAALRSLQEARACVTSSLEVYTQESMLFEHQHALQLRHRIEARIRTLGSDPGK
jgi:tetratricopeptide (TPR) repeat protein